MYNSIVNLTPTLPEVGKIKIGIKGKMMTSRGGKDFQPPQKLDHFVITTLERGDDGNFKINDKIHTKLGVTPRSLNIRLLYDDPVLNFQTRYACYNGVKLWCTGNGAEASRLKDDGKTRAQVPCPCERISPEYVGNMKCKPTGVLSVILEDSQIVGGVWKFRTTSYNSVVNILPSMALISRATGGVLSGIPLQMVLSKKSTVIPGTGSPTIIHVVGLVFVGSMQELADKGMKYALEMATYREQVRQIEHIAKAELLKSGGFTSEETDTDIVEEFYPEQAVCESENSVGSLNSGLMYEFDKETSSIPQDELSIFMALVCATEKKSEDKVKIEIMKEAGGIEKFKAAYQKWYDAKNPKEYDEMPVPESEPDSDRSAAATAPESSPVPGLTANEAIEWCRNHAVQQRYNKAVSAVIVKTAAQSLGIDITGKLPAVVHAIVKQKLAETDEDTQDAKPTAAKAYNTEELELQEFFTEKQVLSRTDPTTAPTFNAALELADMDKSGAWRPKDIEQARAFRDAYLANEGNGGQ